MGVDIPPFSVTLEWLAAFCPPGYCLSCPSFRVIFCFLSELAVLCSLESKFPSTCFIFVRLSMMLIEPRYLYANAKAARVSMTQSVRLLHTYVSICMEMCTRVCGEVLSVSCVHRRVQGGQNQPIALLSLHVQLAVSLFLFCHIFYLLILALALFRLLSRVIAKRLSGAAASFSS